MEHKSGIIFNIAMLSSSKAGRLLFDALPDWVWVRDENGVILDINAAALKRTGYTREEMLGKRIYDFYYDPAGRPAGEAFGRRVLKDGRAIKRQTMRDRAGRPIEVEVNGGILEIDGRKAVVCVARDVSEQLRDERLARTLYEAFRRSNDVMFYCDRNNVILDVNEAFTRHYGYSREEVIGQTPRLLKSSHSTRALYEKMWQGILTRGYWRGDMVNRSKDGREIPLVLTITAVRDASGEIVGYISNAVDMSEQVALQARVADSEALAQIGEMAAVVAHEIRNPLSSIVMAAKQLAAGALSADDRELVMQVLRSESQRLNEALTNFLSYARPRELKLKPWDLNSVVEEVIRMVQGNPELTGRVSVGLTLDEELKAFPIDPDQIRQVVWNIAINALQAMGGAGKLEASTGRAERQAFLRVTDTGPGIPQSALPGIFKPFQTTKQQGTGLGLAIADRIIKAHGGRIQVETGRSGTAFTIYLPYSGE